MSNKRSDQLLGLYAIIENQMKNKLIRANILLEKLKRARTDGAPIDYLKDLLRQTQDLIGDKEQ